MPTYLSLMRWTKEGVEKVKDSPARLDAGRKAVEAVGGKVIGFYMLMGQYDMAIIIEAPDDATLARISLALSGKGATRSETLRAFTEDEYRKILSGL